MLTIDGAQGEGGGQIVRSSLALSLVTGRRVMIDNVRARRKRPGLMRQHLTAVTAAQRICGARVEGAAIASQRLVFDPDRVQAGDYHFDIGSAGSTTLVLQTILPGLMLARGESTVTLEGGTHNPLAPPYEFLARVYLPLVARLGPRVQVHLQRPGFYPAGGGRVAVTIHPCRHLGSLELLDRGQITGQHVRAVLARLPRHIAQRECQTVATRSGWPPGCFEIEEIADSAGPGNAVLIEIVAEHVTELFSGFGERGVRAETVASRLWQAARRYLDAGVPVGPHLADQLLLPLGIAAAAGTGGTFRTLALSQHALTHIQVLHQFLDLQIDVTQHADDDCTVRIGPPGS